MKKLKVLTVVGTRPEIIRLSSVIKELDRETNQVLVHTGQNYDYELNEVFFKDLGLRKPNYFLNAAGKNATQTIAAALSAIDPILEKEKPDAFLVLGDTNSCITAYAAKRRKIPVFHMEAGNRCFDQRVPEEINRRIVDQISDVNLVYSELARHNLLRENFSSDRVIKTGSPMREVLESVLPAVTASTILATLKLNQHHYFIVSAHREENVGDDRQLAQLVTALNLIATHYKMPIIMTLHPRTALRFKARKVKLNSLVKLMKPFGLIDFIALQQHSFCVVSDSGTIYEEAAILNFPAVNIREAHERPEAMDEASAVLTGLSPERILQAIELVTSQGRDGNRTFHCPADYASNNVSKKVVRVILSYTNFVRRVVWSENATA
ncbi:MAG: UDP-N-acetylglucosamine 2-epimerase [Candidatus Magasanikbacteria bacterium RIFCSPHIGHO2_01_FULL_50_8]|uniref:UDP-N-acetylglucosamine 2-epimerase n=2 Tax=Candidatus Magasanikiibacteriota TaxID=1752731 RepID=A0A1F6LP16_9BACT|nr:MAG: UDP-N-acetylglucosamine 2-epimerase [Candidatus Magasanikbacteria bacterium RIFCSPHIGHO2_01_FULL_50_8]OGH67718.1 MAG: UDP-N-acetylglucosamine 2-epimerase [Candidatus Magasanikbacteria bacterium RIFCSPHIGHO2_02_FULL_50_9b]